MSEWNAATNCPDRRCFLHPDGSEHHVEACPLSETLHGQMHRMVHAIGAVGDALVTRAPRETERLWMARTRMGRFTLRLRALGARIWPPVDR